MAVLGRAITPPSAGVPIIVDSSGRTTQTREVLQTSVSAMPREDATAHCVAAEGAGCRGDERQALSPF